MPNHARPVLRNEVSPSFTVRVTQRHINEAVKKNAHQCMLAEAIRDAYGDDRCLYAHVDMTAMRFSDPERDRQFLYFHSHKTLTALLAFDQGRLVKPFEFDLRDGQVRGRHHKSRRKTTKTKTKAKAKRKTAKVFRKYGLCQYALNQKGKS